MNYIILAIIIFSIGLLGVLVRRNLIVILMSIELMISASNILLVYFSKNFGLDGQAAVLLIFVIAACEAAVGLGIIVASFRKFSSVNSGDFCELKN